MVSVLEESKAKEPDSMGTPRLCELMEKIEAIKTKDEELLWLWIGKKIADMMGQWMNLAEVAGNWCIKYCTLQWWLKTQPIVKELYEIGKSRHEAFWLRKGREGIDKGKEFNNGAWFFNVKNRSRHFPSGELWVDRVDIDANIRPDPSGLLAEKATQERMVKIMIQEKLRELEQDGSITINKPLEVMQIEAGTASDTGKSVD